MSSQIEQGPSLLPGAAVPAPQVQAAAPKGRLFFIDNLRVLLISMVVVQHLSVTYGATGSWYYRDPATDLFTTTFLTYWNGPGQAAGMGLFFMIAGYFTVASYDRKGAASFVRDRLLRLGIPLLLYDLLLDPLVVYLAGGLHGSYWSFYGNYLLHVRTIGSGPAWFIAVLLLFSILYVAWRELTRHRTRAVAWPGKLPSYRAIYAFIFALGLLTFALRIWWPLGQTFELFNVSVSYIPQYITLYILGLIAYRCNWFFELTRRKARDWSLIALIATFIFVALLFPFMTFSKGAAGEQFGASMAGGLHLLAFAYALWEAFMVVGVSAGLLVLFRQRWNHQGRLAKSLSTSAYTVYLIHPLVLVGYAYAFHSVALYPLLKFVISVLIALPLCFLLSSFIRKIPFANKIL
jgi:surface polysaccharide O-acyltransferase-like enzyme